MRIVREQSGNVAVLTLAAMTMLLACMAFAIEGSHIFVARNQAQTSADAAALAAARALQKCDANAADRTAAEEAAEAAAAANEIDRVAPGLGGGDIVFGRYYPYGTDETEFTETVVNPNSVQVTVHRDATLNGPVELIMGALIGHETKGVSATAIASRDRRVNGFKTPPGERSSLIPFAGRIDTIGEIGSTVEFFQGSESVGPGNWGIIDLSAETGFTLTDNSGGSTVIDQIENGFTGTVTLDENAEGETSGRSGTMGGSIENALEGRVGDVVAIAVYDTAEDVGTGLIYHIVGFVGLRITSVQTTGRLDNRVITGVITELSDSNSHTDPEAEENCTISKVVLSK